VTGKPLWTTDLAGAALTAAILACGGYFGVLRSDAVADEFRQLTHSTRNLRVQLAETQALLTEAQSVADTSRAELAQRGRLPQQTPLERDLQTLTQFARENLLNIAEVRPLGPVQYPGVIELRYVLRVSGTFDSLLGFLAAFESSPFWADLTHLKIDAATAGGETPERRAELTVSFFASVESKTG